MLRTSLLHPEILHALASAGHGSLVLISDGNFPHATAPYPGAPRVYLNLSPGRLTVGEVLAALLPVVALERAVVMDPQDPATARPAVHVALAAQLGDTPLDHLRRLDFYEATRTDRLALVIATADTQPYANVLLTIGVVTT